MLPDLAGAFTGATYNKRLPTLRDDGVTHSGISATVNGGGFGSASTAGSPTAITTLFDQYRERPQHHRSQRRRVDPQRCS